MKEQIAKAGETTGQPGSSSEGHIEKPAAGMPVLYFQNYLYAGVTWKAPRLPNSGVLNELTATRETAAFTRSLVKLHIARVPN